MSHHRNVHHIKGTSQRTKRPLKDCYKFNATLERRLREW